MGYVLPIPSIQSQQYANRLRKHEQHYSKIEKSAAVRPIIRFADVLDGERHKQQLLTSEEEKWKELKSATSHPASSESNTALLAPAISQLVGKGLTVNKYV